MRYCNPRDSAKQFENLGTARPAATPDCRTQGIRKFLICSTTKFTAQPHSPLAIIATPRELPQDSLNGQAGRCDLFRWERIPWRTAEPQQRSAAQQKHEDCHQGGSPSSLRPNLSVQLLNSVLLALVGRLDHAPLMVHVWIPVDSVFIARSRMRLRQIRAVLPCLLVLRRRLLLESRDPAA